MRKPESVLENSPKQEAIDTRAEIAGIAGVSDNTVAKVKQIESTAAPELKDKAERGEISINTAATIATAA